MLLLTVYQLCICNVIYISSPVNVAPYCILTLHLQRQDQSLSNLWWIIINRLHYKTGRKYTSLHSVIFFHAFGESGIVRTFYDSLIAVEKRAKRCGFHFSIFKTK